jgi:predicted O-linked N-acetylglucosamine transferase (SPINDLY family)
LDRFDEAVAMFEEALRLQPEHAGTWNNLGVTQAGAGKLGDAIASYRRALAIDPGHADVQTNLGNALRDCGRMEEATVAYKRALQLDPANAGAHNHLGIALARQGRREEAMACFRRALELDPQRAETHNNVGIAMAEQGRTDEALTAYRQALAIDPSRSEPYNNLGNVLKDRGELDEAIAAFRRAVEVSPRNAAAHSNWIYTSHFHPRVEESAIAAEQGRWNEQFSAPWRASARRSLRAPDSERRLRIGYVSADFRQHVVGRNVRPLFQQRDRTAIEAICYSGVVQPDGLTAQFHALADEWRNTAGLNDEELAELICRDQIDILVDLTQHMAGNRLTMFARRPAPVQVSFAAYPASTGVEAIGYRISDGWLEKDLRFSIADCQFGEISTRSEAAKHAAWLPYRDQGHERVYLLESFWCYDPCGMHVAVNELPATAYGCITFGSLNNFCKINPDVLQVWGRILRETGNSRLLLLSPEGSHRTRCLDLLAAEGIHAARVEFAAPRSRTAYHELYHCVDVALDPFPYNGHTTSLDALWMGVPVVSLAGELAVSRAGFSQLSNLGLPELVAFSEDEFVAIAVRLANDLPRLARLRSTLRARMESSILMDAPHFARQIESAFRAMWSRWCAEPESP